MKIAKCGDVIPSNWEWYDEFDNWCEVCYEPISTEKYCCNMCEDNAKDTEEFLNYEVNKGVVK